MAIGYSFRARSACYGSRSQGGRLHQRRGATGVRKRGGNDQMKGGGELRGLEADRVRERRGCRAVSAGLRKPVACQAAPIAILAAGLQSDLAREVLAGGAPTPTLTKQPMLVGSPSHEGQNEVGQDWQDSQPSLPCSSEFPQRHHLHEPATV
jgi:hypothetical protein